VFRQITESQWQWYAKQIEKDEEEKATFTRDIVEYLARFINNEAVDQIKRARERKVDSGEGFQDTLKETFGRSLGGTTQPETTSNINETLETIEQSQHNIDDLDLDVIRVVDTNEKIQPVDNEKRKNKITFFPKDQIKPSSESSESKQPERQKRRIVIHKKGSE
jgi:hypothetical protein